MSVGYTLAVGLTASAYERTGANGFADFDGSSDEVSALIDLTGVGGGGWEDEELEELGVCSVKVCAV